MKSSPSLSRVFTRHQLLSVLIIMLFFVADSIFLYSMEHRTAVSDRAYQLRIAAGETNTRMRMTEENVKEVLTTITQDYDGLWSLVNGQKCLDKMKLNRLLISKRLLQSDLEYFFAFRPNDFTVIQECESDEILQRLAVKDYLISQAVSLSTTVKQDVWKLCRIRDQSYLVLIYCYSFENIYVGAAVKPATLFPEILELAKVYDGELVLNGSGQQLLLAQAADRGHLGRVRLPAQMLEGQLQLEADFSVDFLQTLQGNIVGITVVGFLLFLLSLGYTSSLLHRKIIRPLKTISGAISEMDDLSQHHKVPRTSEIAELQTLENTLNTLLEDAVYNRMQLYTGQLEKKEQELRMLRIQLRPHFFLNAISTVSSMTYQNRNEDIRDYLLKLSRFLRYTISSTSNLVSLEEELENVNNYMEMQSIRYPGRTVSFVTGCENAGKLYLPRFLLLTIVENAYKYAMRMDDVLQIFIECREEALPDFSGIRICIEDNGPGFTPEQLEIHNSPADPGNRDSDHIGITNVKNTLALHYGRSDLLLLSNALPNGARIEIRIPWKEA